MLFKKWRESAEKTKYQVAKDLGVRWTTVYRWELDICRPQPDMIKKITAYTGGKVTANDWFSDGARGSA